MDEELRRRIHSLGYELYDHVAKRAPELELPIGGSFDAFLAALKSLAINTDGELLAIQLMQSAAAELNQYQIAKLQAQTATHH